MEVDEQLKRQFGKHDRISGVQNFGKVGCQRVGGVGF